MNILFNKVLGENEKCVFGTSLMVQWLGLRALNSGGGKAGSSPGQGTGSRMVHLGVRMTQLKIPHAKIGRPPTHMPQLKIHLLQLKDPACCN